AKGTDTIRQVGGRAVKDLDAFERQLERIGRDLPHDGLDPLPDRRRPDIDRDRAVGFDRHARVLFRSGSAAFNETGDADAVIAATDQLTGETELLIPARLRNAAL